MTTTTRADAVLTGDERTMLGSYLDHHRATVRLKCAGLDDDLARQAPLPSELMTPIGLVSHLRWVEHYWFDVVLGGATNEAPYVPEGSHPDADFIVPAGVSLAETLDAYDAQCERSRGVVAGLDLDSEVPIGTKGKVVSVRHVVLHLIEETARHNGHLDVIRELIDGVTGE